MNPVRQHACPIALYSIVSLLASFSLADFPREGLVASYDFENLKMELLLDGSGLNNHGRLFNALPCRDAHGNGTALFNGSNSYSRIPFSPSLALSNYTVTAWVWSDDENAIPDRGVFGKHLENNNISYFWLFQHERQIQATMVGNVRDQFQHLTCDATPWIKKWAFIAVSFDGEFFTLSVNGNLVGVQPIQGYQGNSYDLLIGAGELAQAGNQPQRWWKGQIDEVRVYNRGLSADELARIAKTRTFTPTASATQPVAVQQAPTDQNSPKAPTSSSAVRSPTMEEIKQALGNLSPEQLNGIFQSVSPAIHLMPGVTRIAFSNGSSPWEDETVFSTDETITIHVNDIDLEAASDKGATVKIVATQRGDPKNGLAPYERTIDLLPSKEGTFEGKLALNVFVPGTVCISVIGLTPGGTQLYRLSKITIK